MIGADKYTQKPPTGFIKLAFAVLAVCFFSCNENKPARLIEPAFYYWKSVLNISSTELAKLDSLHATTLYIKFFDVDWNDDLQQAIPVAKLQSSNFKLPKKFSIIPTVFITNGCIQKIHSTQITALADNIYRLVQTVINTNGFTAIKEIQIDCDWTASTRSNYFLLLEKINALWKDANIPVSATIRLHQIKFMSKTGVPPVKKGLLMCYNMGNLKNPATTNSIIETAELEKYTRNLSSYPLPLDIGLPLFDWKVLFRNNVYTGLVESLPNSLLTDAVVSKDQNRFTFKKDTVLNGYSFKKGDMLRNEQSSYKEILSAAQSISRHLKNTTLRVSLYHLDSVILNKYSIHELETVYNSLH